MSSTNKTPKKDKQKKIGYWLYDFVKLTAIVPVFLYVRHKTICVGEKKPHKVKGGALIVSNHFSFVDPITVHCVFWRRRLRILATKDLYTTKLKRFFFDHMQCIIVDKENFSMRSLHAVCDTLKKGKLVTIFPEGGVNRSDSHEINSFKSGAVLMAFQSNVPVIPVCIIKRKHWYNRQVVVLGDPVNIRDICGNKPTVEDLKKASEYLREQEVALMEHYDKLQKEKHKKSKSKGDK